MVAGYPAAGAGGGDLGSARGEIELSADGAIKALEAVGAGLRNLDKQSASFGAGWAQAIKSHEQQLTSWGKGLVGVGGIIMGAIAAPMLAGSKAAWTQVDAVEQATVALKAYEKDGAKVNAVLSDLIKYAQSDMGVLFQRTDLFASAQALKLYGDETENLSGHVQILSRSVGLGFSTWDDLNRVVGRVGSTGRLTGNDFDYLKAAGFQLDDSLRNTNITWDQLFEALDKGMPADAMAGQADTIRGKTIRLQSALRNLGLEFLGVDKNTSKFIKGGLGDTLVKGLGQARSALLGMAPAARVFGNALASVARVISGAIDLMLKLPQPIKTAILVIAGFSGAAMVAAGTFLLFLPRIANVALALQRLGGLTGIIGKLGTTLRALTLSSPLFWVLAAAVAAFLAYRSNFLGFADGVNAVVGALKNLEIVKQITQWVSGLSDAFGAFFGAFGKIGGTKDVEIKVSGDDKILERIANPDAADGFDYYVRIKNPDGSFKEFGQVMESYTDEDDPNIAHIKIKTDDGEYWTTINNDTGEVGDGTITVDADTKDARSKIERLNDGLDAMDASLRKNGLGKFADGLKAVRNGVTAAARTIRDLQYNFAQFRAAGVGPVTAALYSLGAVFPGLRGYIEPVTKAIASLSDNFRLFRSLGMDPVTAGLASLMTTFPGLSGVVQPLIRIVADLKAAWKDLSGAFGDFLDGDWSKGFGKLGEAAGHLWDAFREGLGLAKDLAVAVGQKLWDALSGIDWGAVGGALLSGIQTAASFIWSAAIDFAGWFWEQVSGVDWGGLLSSAWDVLTAAGGWLVEKLGEITGAVGSWFFAQVASVDWGAKFRSAIAVLSAVGSWIVTQLGEAATAIGRWFYAQIASVDWGEKFRSALVVLANVGQWIVDQLGSIVDTLGTWVTGQVEGVDWLAVAATVATKLRGAVRDGVQFMSDITSIVLNWITKQIEGVNWSSVGSTFARLLVGAIKGVVLLVGFAAYLLGQLLLALVDVNWSAVATAFKDFFVAAIKAVAGFLTGFATTLYDEIITAIGEVDWGSVGSTLKDMFVSAVKGVGSAMWNAIKSEIPGMGGGDDDIQSPGGGGGNAFNFMDPNALRGLKGSGAAGGLGSAFGAGAGTGMFAPLMAEVDALIAKLGEISPALTTAQTGITGFVSATIGVMGGWSTGIQTMVNTTLDTLKSRASGATAGAQASFVAFVANTIAVMGGWSGGIQNIVNTTLDTLKSRASGGTSSAKQSFVTFVADTIAVMGGWSSGIQNIVRNAMSAMVSAAQRGGSDMASALRRGADDGVQDVDSAISRIPGIIDGIAGAMGSAGLNAGSAAGFGVANGLRAARDAVASEAAAIANIVAATMALRLQMHSPSRLLERMFETGVGPAVVNGIRAGIPAVIRATRDLAGAAIPTMGSGYGPYAASTPSYAYAPSQRPATIIHNHETKVYAVRSDEWLYMVRQIETAPERAAKYQSAGFSDVVGIGD